LSYKTAIVTVEAKFVSRDGKISVILRRIIPPQKNRVGRCMRNVTAETVGSAHRAMLKFRRGGFFTYVLDLPSRRKGYLLVVAAVAQISFGDPQKMLERRDVEPVASDAPLALRGRAMHASSLPFEC
jgi:hypothetical protein